MHSRFGKNTENGGRTVPRSDHAVGKGEEMQVREFYTKIGGDAASVLDRLGTEELVVRFARKFPADTSYTQLCEAMAQGDAETGVPRRTYTQGVVPESSALSRCIRSMRRLPRSCARASSRRLRRRCQEFREKYEELVGLIAEL